MKELIKPPETKGLKNLQKFQYEHDKNFHPDIFSMKNQDQIRHIAHHLSKIAGIFGDYFDKLDHNETEDAEKILKGIKEKRIADSFIFSLMLANRLGLDLEKEYFKRIEDLEKERIE